MAIDFSKPEDWGVTPEEAVASRSKALSSYESAAAAEKEAQKAERGKYLLDTYRQAYKTIQEDAPSRLPGLIGEAQRKAAELVPQQAEAQDVTAAKGAGLKEDIIAGRQERAVSNYNRTTEEMKQKTADYITKRSFDLGYTARQLAYHQSGYVADRALQQTKDDLDAGRVTTAELNRLQNSFILESKRLQAQLNEMQAKLKGQLEVDLANQDKESLKNRLSKYLDTMKSLAKSQAKANMISSFISGGSKIGGSLIKAVTLGG